METLQEFEAIFGTDEKWLQWLFELRHENPICRKCGRRNQFYRNPAKPCFTCACGGQHIYPKTGTFMECSRLPLSMWFFAFYVLWRARGARVTYRELEQKLDVCYPTAWRIGNLLCNLVPITGPRQDRCFKNILAAVQRGERGR